MDEQRWTVTAAAGEVSRLRHAIVDYGASRGIQPRVLDDMAIALSEILTNAVVHAFPDGGDGTIAVSAAVDDDALAIRVVDDGVGMRRPSARPGAGFGLALAGRLARRFAVEERPQGGTQVSLLF